MRIQEAHDALRKQEQWSELLMALADPLTRLSGRSIDYENRLFHMAGSGFLTDGKKAFLIMILPCSLSDGVFEVLVSIISLPFRGSVNVLSGKGTTPVSPCFG